MKKYSIHIVLCSFFLLFTACDDFLDEEPESTLAIDNFFSNTIEAEIALSGITSEFTSPDVYGNSMSIIMASGTDEGYYNRRFNELWTVGLYRHTTADGFVERLWTRLYSAINLANLFSEQLQQDNFEPEEYNRLLAEAFFFRAHAYSLLVTWYGEVPIPLTSTKDQSANNLAPSSLEEVYAQIIEDFTFASLHLPSVDDSNFVQGRPTKTAAHGLMARMFLQMAGAPLNDTSRYEDAREQAEIVINSGLHSLNTTDGDGYRNHFLSYIQGNYDVQESIYEISFRNLRDSGLITDGRIGATNGIPFNLGGNNSPRAFGGFNTTRLLSSSYEAGDMRQAWNIPGYIYNNRGDIRAVTDPLTRDFVPGKYRRWEPVDFADVTIDFPPSSDTQPEPQPEPVTILENGLVSSANATNVNFPVLRYADVLLMCAEADLREKNVPTTLAINCLNEVRNRAGLGDIDPSEISTVDDFFEEIVDERFRELCFEGIRKHDLIRWGLLGTKLDELNESIRGDSNFSLLNADHQSFLRAGLFFDPAKHLSLPYPLQEVNINANLDQKTEWL